MTLSPQEKQSALWLRFKAHLEERLEALREQNDNDHPAEYTAKLRGRIAMVSEILRLGETPEQVPPEIGAD